MKNLFTLFTLIFVTNTYAQDWQLTDEFAPMESAESDYGINMVFADDKLVVSWPRTFTRGNDADNCGEIITYIKVDDSYQEMTRLTAQDLTGTCVDGDGFGFGLAYSNGKLAIGMPAGVRGMLGASGGATDADSRVFITTFENDNWVLQETLIGSDLAAGKGMGFQLVMENDVLLVHAHEYNTLFGFSFPVSTGVYVFENSGAGFVETQKLTENFNLFGQDFDYENDQIIVGAWGEQALNQPGRVYVYEKNGTSWQNVQTINDSRNANLGNQIEIFGNTLAVGNVQAGGVGGVTLFNKANGQWLEAQFIQASDNTLNDQFGLTVRLGEDDLIIGAGAGQDSVVTLGAVYTYSKNSNGQFFEQQKLVASDPSSLFDRFAGNLIFNDNDMLVNSTSGGFDNGDVTSFHHFSRAGNTNPPSTSYSVDTKVSGIWQANNVDNQKISIEILNDGRAVMFGSLNNAGDNLWLFAVGEISDNSIDFSQVYSTSGGIFGNDFNSNDVTTNNEGQALISFNLCNQATLSYDLPAIETSEVVINKDTEIPGNECASTNKALPNGISGAWFDQNRAGEGFTVYLFTKSNTQMATVTWYTYDSNGNQIWLSGTGTVANQTISINEIQQFTGANLLSGNSQATTFGNLSMTWDNCHNAVVDYDFSQVDLGSGQFNLSQLTALDNTQCDLPK